MPVIAGTLRIPKAKPDGTEQLVALPNVWLEAAGPTTVRVKTSATGTYSFTLPNGSYEITTYYGLDMTLAPIRFVQAGGELFVVTASTPRGALDDFLYRPNAGKVDGALLEQFRNLAAQSTQGAADAIAAANLSATNAAAALKRMDDAGVLLPSVDDGTVTDFRAFPDVTQHYTIGRAMANGPKGAAPIVYTGMAYVFKRKYGANLEKVILYEDNTGSYRLERRSGVWGEWSNQADTQMKENGLWDLSKLSGVNDLIFTKPVNGFRYITGGNQAELQQYPEGRAGAYILPHNHSTSNTSYSTIDFTQATGTKEKYRIQMDAGVWGPARQYHMNQFGDQSFTAWRATDLPTKMTGWYAMTGDSVLLSSRVGQNLNSLPQTYKDDWGIKVTGTMINLPNWFHNDGRGYGPRANLAVGTKLEDAIQKLEGWFYVTRQASDAGHLCVAGHGGVFKPHRTLPTQTAVTVSYIQNAEMTSGVVMDSSIQARTANENRGMSIGLLPVIYLGV